MLLCSLVKKDKMVSCRAPGCADGADKNSNTIAVTIICYYNCITAYSEHWHI